MDTASAHFHLKAAADCANLAALIAISQLYSGLPNDILPALTTEEVQTFVKGEVRLFIFYLMMQRSIFLSFSHSNCNVLASSYFRISIYFFYPFLYVDLCIVKYY